MAFQFDRVGVAAVVERAGVLIGLHPFQEDVEPSISGWRRGWRFVWRRWIGDRRWQVKLRFEQTRQMVAEIRRCMKPSHKPTLVYLIPYDISKMRSGGAKRITGIAKALSNKFSVFILTPILSSENSFVVHLNSDCRLVGISVDSEFVEQRRTQPSVSGAGIFDVADYFYLLPTFQKVLDILAGSAHVWGFASPAGWPVVQRYWKKKESVFYDAHDDYPHFLQSAFGCTDERLIQRMIHLEGEALGQVEVASFCTTSDLESALSRFPANEKKMIMVPNGVNVRDCRAFNPAQAKSFRLQAGMTKNVAVFVGAHHRPNLEAVDQIVSKLAPAFPSVVFVIVGIHFSVYRAAGGVEPCENVVFTGPVSEDTKEVIFALADVALAPMKSGTGSSLKIPEYIAHGKVVVGSPIGFRGFEELLRFSSIVADEDVQGAFARVLERFEQNPEYFTESCRDARQWIESHFDWTAATRTMLDRLD